MKHIHKFTEKLFTGPKDKKKIKKKSFGVSFSCEVSRRFEQTGVWKQKAADMTKEKAQRSVSRSIKSADYSLD